MFGAAYFGKTYFGPSYWGPGTGVAPVVVKHSPYYSEFSDYAISADGEIRQRFPWGKKKAVSRSEDDDVRDILSIFEKALKGRQ